MWWHRDDGGHTAILLGEARKYATVIYTDSHSKTCFVKLSHRVPKKAVADMKPLMFKRREYPVKRAARLLSQAGRRLGISKSAQRALKELRK
jgi:hypothetical protein